MKKVSILMPDICVIADFHPTIIPDQYQLFVGKNSAGQDIGVFIRKEWRCKNFIVNNLNCCLLVAKIGNISITVAACYIPWYFCEKKFVSCLNDIESKCVLFNSDITVTVGDFNASTSSRWLTPSGKKGAALKHWCECHEFNIPDYEESEWTFMSGMCDKSTIDHLIFRAKKRATREERKLFELEASDHRLMLTSIRYHDELVRERRFVGRFLLPIDLSTNGNCPLKRLNDIESEFYCFEYKEKSIDPAATSISRNISRLINQVKTRNFSDFPTQLKELIKEAEDKIWRSSRCANIFTNSMDAAMCKSNPWAVIRKVTNRNSIKDIIGESNPDAMFAQKIHERSILNMFKLAFSNPAESELNLSTEFVTRSEVQKLLEKYDAKLIFAPPPAFYQDERCLPFTTAAVNAAIVKAYFPKRWARGKATFIPKKNSNKVRMIVCQHPLGMILQDFIYAALEKKINELNFTALVKQHAFIAGKGVQQAIYKFHMIVKKFSKYPFILMDADVSGAFDSVPWHVIEDTLRFFKIDGHIIELTMSYLRNFTMWTAIDGEFKGMKLEKGFPQGSKIGPALWTLITARIIPLMEKVMKHVQGDFILYADDIKICIAGGSITLADEVIRDIKKIVAVFGLSLNEQKTKFFINDTSIRHFKDKNSILSRRVERIALLGYQYSFPDRAKIMFWRTYKERAIELALAIAPFFQQLTSISKACEKLIINQCILSIYAHCIPTILEDSSLENVLGHLWKIEGSIVGCIYAHGHSLRGSMAVQTTGLLCGDFLKSIIASIIADKQFEDHRIIGRHFDREKLRGWYSKKGLKYHPFTNIREVISPVKSDVVVTFKPIFANRELRAIIKLKCTKQKWSILFPRSYSLFDMVRVGLYTILKGFAENKQSRSFMVITKDSSLLRCGGCLDIWQTGFVKILNIFISKEAPHLFAKKFKEDWNPDATLEAEDIIGNVAIKYELEKIVDGRIEALWRKKSFNGYVDIELWRDLKQCPADDFKRGKAMRYLFQFCGNPKEFCECDERGIMHFTCRCYATYAIRSKIHVSTKDYLKRSEMLGKFFTTPNTLICNDLIEYLSQLYFFCMKNYYNPRKNRMNDDDM